MHPFNVCNILILTLIEDCKLFLFITWCTKKFVESIELVKTSTETHLYDVEVVSKNNVWCVVNAVENS